MRNKSMQATVATTSELEKVITISVPAEELNKEYDKKIKALASKKRIDGFRPGKAPVKVIERYYGSQAISEAADSLINLNYFKAIQENKIRVAGRPTVSLKTFELGKDFEFEAKVSVFPEIKLADLSQVAVDRVKSEIKDSDIDEMIETIRKQQAKWADPAAENVSENNDKMVINFVGTLDGVEFAGGKADNFEYVLGSHNLLKDMEDSLYGKKAGDKFDTNVTFPENYNNKDLNGKTASFAIEVVSVAKIILPEVNEEFIKSLHVENPTVENFRNELSKNMNRQLSEMVNRQNQGFVVNALLNANQFEVPADAIEEESKALYEARVEKFKQYYGDKAKAPEFNIDEFKDAAKEKIRISLIMNQIVDENKIELDEAKLDDYIKQMAVSYEDSEEVIKFYKSNKNIMARFSDEVMNQQIVEFVFSKAQVTEKELSFSELQQTR